MHIHSDAYVNKCIELGILTEEKIRKYPLRSANLAIVLKAYAITVNVPYTLDGHHYDILDKYKLYLTEGGLEWLFDVFKQHSLQYLRVVFQFVFSNATQQNIDNPDTYSGYNNFKGLIGDKPKAGTKQKAILERSYGKNGKIKKIFEFDTIIEARAAIMNLTRYYPIEEFKLYRIRTQTKGDAIYTYKSEIPLILEESKRGLNSGLGDRRRKHDST